MLYISSPFELIKIPPETEYTIYTEDYYIDEGGVVYYEFPHPKVYEYGDLIIETPFKKYTFRRVYSAYQYSAAMLYHIRKHKNESVIFIDLETLNDVNGFRAEGGYEVISKIPG